MSKRLPLRFTLLVTACLGFMGLASLQGCNSGSDIEVEQWQLVKGCDLHTETCEASHGDSKLSLKISPHPIPIARPLGIEVDLHNLNPSKVQLDISGINMYMGYNRVDLTSTKPGHWVGTSMLAFCTAETMQWQITLMLEENGKQIQVPFYLETSNRIK